MKAPPMVVECNVDGRYHGTIIAQRIIFTAQRHASTVYAIVVCLSVCLSITSRCSTEIAKRRITQTMPSDSSGTLGFSDAEDLCKTRTGSPPTEAPNAGGVG